MTRYRSCAILVVLLVACVTVRVQADPLRLVVACSQAAEVTFRFTIQNVSAASSAVVIGAKNELGPMGYKYAYQGRP